jgi:hypothetical protein
MELSAAVRSEINKQFHPEEAQLVQALLQEADLPLSESTARARDRVHLAILKVSAGKLSRFGDALDLAEKDWRDVLVQAGLENEDWPEVLREAGMPVP